MQLDELVLDKVIILYMMDTMEIPLSIEMMTDICAANEWVNYMDCRQCIYDLIESDFIVNISKNNTELYVLSANGKECLKIFFTKIPLSLRDTIKAHIRENCQSYRRRQDYFSNYYKNDDGSFTVLLRINTPSQPLMELKLCVQSVTSAKWINKMWIEKAPIVYELIHANLLE